MSRSLNKTQLIGNLGADPDVRFMPDGTPVATLSVGTDEGYKDRESGQMVPRTEWHRVVLFQGLAEVAQKYLVKGSKVYIEGRNRTRKWQGQDGSDRYTHEIVVNRGGQMIMLGGKGKDQGDGQPADPPAEDFDEDIAW